MSDEPFGLVFVGVQHPHQNLWADAAIESGAKIVGAWDPVPAHLDEFVERYGCPRVSRDDLGSTAANAAYVGGRNDEAFAHCQSALEQGLSVLCDKPGGVSAHELERIDSIARECSAFVQLGYFLRYADSVADVKRSLDTGDLGTLSLARFHAAMPVTGWDEAGYWFLDASHVRGVFQEDACHIVDICVHLLGSPREVVALRTTEGFEHLSGEHALAAVLKYETFLAVIDFTAWEANDWNENWRVELYGTDATLFAGLTPAWIDRYVAKLGWRFEGDRRPEDLVSLERKMAIDHSECFRRGFQAFRAAVQGTTPASADSRSGLEVFHLVEAIQAAADTGTSVTLP